MEENKIIESNCPTGKCPVPFINLIKEGQDFWKTKDAVSGTGVFYIDRENKVIHWWWLENTKTQFKYQQINIDNVYLNIEEMEESTVEEYLSLVGSIDELEINHWLRVAKLDKEK